LGVGEVVPAELTVISSAGGARHVPQPCAALEGCRCRAYEGRPLACRRYECLLVGALRSGEVSMPEAIAVVARARELVRTGTPAEREDYLTFHFGRRT